MLYTAHTVATALAEYQSPSANDAPPPTHPALNSHTLTSWRTARLSCAHTSWCPAGASPPRATDPSPSPRCTDTRGFLRVKGVGLQLQTHIARYGPTLRHRNTPSQIRSLNSRSHPGGLAALLKLTLHPQCETDGLLLLLPAVTARTASTPMPAGFANAPLGCNRACIGGLAQTALSAI